MLIIPELQSSAFIIRVSLQNESSAYFHNLRRVNNETKPIASRLKSHAKLFADLEICKRYLLFLSDHRIPADIEEILPNDPHLGSLFSQLKSVQPDQQRIEFHHRRVVISSVSTPACRAMAAAVSWIKTNR